MEADRLRGLYAVEEGVGLAGVRHKEAVPDLHLAVGAAKGAVINVVVVDGGGGEVVGLGLGKYGLGVYAGVIEVVD